MEHSGNPYRQPLLSTLDLRLVVELQSVIHSQTSRAVIVQPVERVSHIKCIAVLVTHIVLAVVVWHHILSDKKSVADSDIPMPCLKVDLTSSREYIVSDIIPVVLKGLQPAQAGRKTLHTDLFAEIEPHIWIQKDIVHYPLMLKGVCIVIHIGRISEREEWGHKAFSAGEYHKAFTRIVSVLAHPVTGYLKLRLRSSDLNEKTFKIVVIESKGV